MATLVFYSELKNLIMRVAQVKNLCGEHEWRVTPRSVTTPTLPVAAGAAAVRSDQAAA